MHIPIRRAANECGLVRERERYNLGRRRVKKGRAPEPDLHLRGVECGCALCLCVVAWWEAVRRGTILNARDVVAPRGRRGRGASGRVQTSNDCVSVLLCTSAARWIYYSFDLFFLYKIYPLQ